MKIVERHDITEWKYAFVCDRCDSKLEASADDLRAKHHPACNDPREYLPEYHTFHVQCPVCQQEKQVEEKAIPKLLRHTTIEGSQRHSTNYFDR